MNEDELDQYLYNSVPGYANASPQVQAQVRSRYKAQQGQQPQQPSSVNQAMQLGTGIALNQGVNAALGAGSTAATTGSTVGGMSIGTGGGMSMAGSSAAPAAVSTPAAPGLMSTVGLPAIGAAAMLSNMYDMGGKEIINNKGKSNDYINLALNSNPMTAIPNRITKEVFGTDAGSILGKGAGKNKDQQGRDQYRGTLQSAGVYDKDFNLTLSDGTKVNMGQDGSIKNYNVDFNEKGIGDIVSYVNPFAYLVAGGDPKKASDLAGELTNAIKNSKDPMMEARRLYEQAGITYDSAISQIDKLGVDDATKNVFKGTIKQIGVTNPQVQSTGGNSAQSDELARVRAATQGFMSKIKQDAAAQQAANKEAVKKSAEQQKSSYRSGVLNDLLNKTAEPIKYPTPRQNSTQPVLQNLGIQPGTAAASAGGFNKSLSKILGRA